MNKRPLALLLCMKIQYANVALLAQRIGILLLAALIALPAVAEPSNDSDFERCKASLKEAALQADVAEATIDKVLALATYDASIIELDGKQPEFTTTFADYLNKRVTQTRISKGRELGVIHAALLERLTRQYGVPGQYLLAFWGLETNFGDYMGKKQAPSALATLACDERRASFFTRELIATMQLVERNTLEPQAMESSWAGALGQTQFMPTTYLRYAVDGDGDGVVNLWSSIDDALASAAHYLSELGWQTGLFWGREIVLPSTFDWSAIGRKQVKTLAKWHSLGSVAFFDLCKLAVASKRNYLVRANA